MRFSLFKFLAVVMALLMGSSNGWGMEDENGPLFKRRKIEENFKDKVELGQIAIIEEENKKKSFKLTTDQLDKIREKIKEKTSENIPSVDQLDFDTPSCEGFQAIVKLLKEKDKKDTGPIKPTKSARAKAALKVFVDSEKGQKEFENASRAIEKNPQPKIFKMVDIFMYTPKTNHPYLIVYEAAKGELILDILKGKEDYKEEALMAAIQYLAKFHYAAYANIKEKEMVYERANAEHRIDDDIHRFSESYFPSEKFNVTLWNGLSTTAESDEKITIEEFECFLKNLRTNLTKRKERPDLIVTTIHGDTHWGNIFFDPEVAVENLENYFSKITLIDYDTMGLGAHVPARDVGRFIGSLWRWGAQYGEKWETIFLWENKLIEQYLANFPLCKKFEMEFREDVEFYKFQLFRYIFEKTEKTNDQEIKQTLMGMLIPKIKELLKSKSSLRDTRVSVNSAPATNPPTKLDDPLSFMEKTLPTALTTFQWLWRSRVKEQKAKKAVAHLFQPLITELRVIKDLENKEREDLIKDLEKHQRSLSTILISENLPKESDKTYFNTSISNLNNFKNKYPLSGLNNLDLYSFNGYDSFFDSIISLRNTLYSGILGKYYGNGSYCDKSCGCNSIIVEKVLGEPIDQCWVCGYEKRFSL